MVTREFKIHNIPLAVLIGVRRRGICLARRPEQLPAQELCIGLKQIQRRSKDPGLVPASRMRLVEAVIPELGDIHNSEFSARKPHLARA